jgi:lipopolysaccharide biosynthesis glycosyltransferase
MIAFFTALNDSFMPGMRAFLKSLLKNNSWLNADFLILSDGHLSQKSIDELYRLYSRIKVIDVMKKDYLQCKDTIENWNFNLFYRFDVFELGHFNYDKIIMIDSDMLVLKDIKDLLQFNHDFAACRKYPDLMPELSNFKNDFFNCGLMVLSKEIINKQHKTNLINLAKEKNWSSDQPLFNLYFRNNVAFLPQKFNTVSSGVTKQTLNDVSILHFHGDLKPWMHSNANECFKPFVNTLLTRAGEDSDEIINILKNLYEEYR